MANLLKQMAKNATPKPRLTTSQLNQIQGLLNTALDEHGSGNIGRAATLYGEILAIEPNHFDALHLLGLAAHQSGNPQDALSMIDRALAIRQDVSDAHSNRSSVLMELARFPEALEACQKSIELNPKNADAYYNCGNALAQMDRGKESIEFYQKAIALRPSFVAAWSNLGSELVDQGASIEAKAAFERAIELDPDHAKAWLNLGVLATETGDREAAYSSYNRALHIEPNYGLALVNLSAIAHQDGQLTGALELAKKAVEVDSTFGTAHNALGNCLRALGQPAQAQVEFLQAISREPLAESFHSNLILSMLGDANSTPQDILGEAMRSATRYATIRRANISTGSSLRKIGFFGADFRIHPVGFFMETLLQGLAGEVETHIFANQSTCDFQTEKIQQLATGWHDVLRLSAVEKQKYVMEQEIDVLVDLAGHTSGGCLELFALGAAPVQVSWLGYSGTTGLLQFDAILGDATVTPRSDEEDYSEPIFRLPGGFAPFFVDNSAPDVSETPCLKNGYITFGSFNATTKINDLVIKVWSQVLQAVPNSRMILKNLYLADSTVQARIVSEFQKNGIDESRLTFLGQTSREDHFATLGKVDIGLDTYPYSGATTTVDSLWMGLPIVTLVGDRYVSRMSASFLNTLGLTELIASSEDEFVGIAKNLAQQPEELSRLRSELRSKIANSPRSDPQEYASGFLQLLNGMFEEARIQAA